MCSGLMWMPRRWCDVVCWFLLLFRRRLLAVLGFTRKSQPESVLPLQAAIDRSIQNELNNKGNHIGFLKNEDESWNRWNETEDAVVNRTNNQEDQSLVDNKNVAVLRIERRKIDSLFAEMEPKHTSAPTLLLNDSEDNNRQISTRLAMDEAYGKSDLLDWEEVEAESGWQEPEDDIDLSEVRATLREQQRLRREQSVGIQRRREREERQRSRKSRSNNVEC
eukprot:gene286-3656_t